MRYVANGDSTYSRWYQILKGSVSGLCRGVWYGYIQIVVYMSLLGISASLNARVSVLLNYGVLPVAGPCFFILLFSISYSLLKTFLPARNIVIAQGLFMLIVLLLPPYNDIGFDILGEDILSIDSCLTGVISYVIFYIISMEFLVKLQNHPKILQWARRTFNVVIILPLVFLSIFFFIVYIM